MPGLLITANFLLAGDVVVASPAGRFKAALTVAEILELPRGATAIEVRWAETAIRHRFTPEAELELAPGAAGRTKQRPGPDARYP